MEDLMTDQTHSVIPDDAYSRPEIPVASYEAAMLHLRRPFGPNAVKFKIQATWPKNGPTNGAIIVAYIDARLVIDRLNLICGPDWSAEYIQDPDHANAMVCRLTVFGVTREDVGIGQGQGSGQIDKLKGLRSDALKRAAVHFGVGVPLYAVPQFMLNASNTRGTESGSDQPKLKRGQDGKVKRLEADVEQWLRKQYEQWLTNSGTDAFGPYLDHGDSPGSVGDLVEQTPEAEADTSTAVEVTADPAQPTEPVVTAAMRRQILEQATESEIVGERKHIAEAIVEFITGSSHTDRIPRAQFQQVVDALKNWETTIEEIVDLANEPEVDGHVPALKVRDKYLSDE